jgi:hypothetical protein
LKIEMEEMKGLKIKLEVIAGRGPRWRRWTWRNDRGVL